MPIAEGYTEHCLGLVITYGEGRGGGGGWGYKMGNAPPSRQGKTFRSPPFKEHLKTFFVPPLQYG